MPVVGFLTNGLRDFLCNCRFPASRLGEILRRNLPAEDEALPDFGLVPRERELFSRWCGRG